MHGRIKTRTTAEQEEIKKKERAKKVESYKAGISLVFGKRQKGEKDEQGLSVSAKILIGNPDIYTLWNVRREIVLHLKTLKNEEEFNQLMEEELRLTEICLRTQPKSYGTWHHRCWVLDNMSNPSWQTELALCNKYLEYDERNFHCWDYRRFIVERAGVSAELELRFTDEKIATNFSNYSAWHLRSNLLPLVHPDPEGLKPIQDDQHKSELELVTNAAFTDPSDQSAWFYQRWLLGRHVPELRITHIYASEHVICLAFNQSLSPSLSAIQVKSFDEQPWRTVDGEISSYIWCKDMPGKVAISDLLLEPVQLIMQGEMRQSISLSGHESSLVASYCDTPRFQSGFSAGVTEALQNVLDSCQTLLELEPNTKWPLLTSVLLMQAIDRNKFKDQIQDYLNLLAKIDHLRANYYLDLKSRFVMEYALERWNFTGAFDLNNADLSALYHSQYLLLAQQVDLSGNALGRSLPRLSSLQFCQVLNLDNNGLQNLKGFPKLPLLSILSIKKNQLKSPEDIEPYIKPCTSLTNVHINENPLAATHVFSKVGFIKV